MFFHRAPILSSLAIVAMLASASGCFLSGDSAPKLGGSCKVSEDQKAAFMVRMNVSQVVHVAIDPRFDGNQHSAISQAIAEWNSFSQRSFGKNFFQEDVSAAPADAVPPRLDSCSFEGSGDDSFHIVREDDSSVWSSLQLTTSNPGVTIRCHTDSDLVKQVVLLNMSIAKPLQIASIALHELGHAVGLDHSCVNGAGRGDYAGCDGLSGSHPYHLAVMFPMLQLGGSTGTDYPETKEHLRSNDMERAFCLYNGS